MSKRSVWMLLAVAFLILVPLVLGGEFGGADGEVADIIAARKGFAPWANPIWTPPSAEIESLFFALQAALGAFVVGYVIGRVHGRRRPADADGRTTEG